MGFIVTSLKWGTKLGLAGGSVYVAYQYSLFGSSEQSLRGWRQIKDNVTSQIPKEVKDQTPEMPTLNMSEYMPNVEVASVGQNARGYWNRGVMATFAALANSPTTIKGYGNDLVNYVSEQMKIEDSSDEESKKEKVSEEKDCDDCKSEQKSK